MNAWSNRAGEVGIALSRGRLAAWMPRTRGAEQVYACELAPPGRTDGEWADLHDAFAELGERLGTRGPVAHVALLPPLVQAKRVELPLLREDELRRVLSRDASRYFVGAREPQVVGVVGLDGGRGAPSAVLAAAAPSGLVNLLYDAASSAGWRIATIVPAHAAWHAGARALWPDLRRRGGHLVLLEPDCAEVLQLQGRHLLSARRLYTNGTGPDRLADSLLEAARGSRADEALAETPGGAGAVALAGAEPLRRSVEEAVRARELSPLPSPAHTALVDSPELLAAAFASRAAGPELLPERVHIERGRRATRRTLQLLAVAAALLASGAGLHLWGLQRELNAVVERRDALRADVAQVMDVRDALTSVGSRLATFTDAEATAPRWSAAVAELADYLPRDAHLTALRMRADTLLIEGAAVHASGVITSLRRAPRLEEVEPTGPIQQQMREGAPPVERFSIRARWRPLEPTAPEVQP